MRVIPLALLMGGCFLAPWSPNRPDPAAVSGTPVYVEGCDTCHAPAITEPYAASAHSAQGVRCGQCHTPGAHPDFSQPVADARCGGCHQPEYQQTLLSKHFATRVEHPLDSDRAARATLRRARFIATGPAGRAFTGDAASGEGGGRLCAACHYDEHRLGVRAVTRADFCTTCHGGREGHFGTATSSPTNRCVECHVRVGETASGQTVNTHQFGVPGR